MTVEEKILGDANFGVRCDPFEVTSDRVREVLEWAVEASADLQRDITRTLLQDTVFSYCDSDIERLMAISLKMLGLGWGGYPHSVGNEIIPCPPFLDGMKAQPNYDDWIRRLAMRRYWHQGVFVFAQAPIGPYRVDFLVGALEAPDDKIAWVVVECDGHDFHEKTKEQAQRDKKRDRYLAGYGYHVLRFTGSEIYRDPLECAGEVMRFLEPLVFQSACEMGDDT